MTNLQAGHVKSVPMSSFKQFRQAVLTAADARAVRGALLECLTEMRAEISLLPPECQAALAEREADIDVVAMTLLHADMAFKGDPAVGAVLRDVANVYAAASVRLTQIHTRHQAAQ